MHSRGIEPAIKVCYSHAAIDQLLKANEELNNGQRTSLKRIMEEIHKNPEVYMDRYGHSWGLDEPLDSDVGVIAANRMKIPIEETGMLLYLDYEWPKSKARLDIVGVILRYAISL